MKLRKYLFFIALTLLSIIVLMSISAPLISPHTPLDLASLELKNSNIPPSWEEGGTTEFLLGTDTQGRDIFSTLLYSTSISLFIAGVAVLFSMVIGVGLGIISGYFGGWVDVIIMRVVDIKLALPAILLAMLVGGIMRNLFEVQSMVVSLSILIIALIFATWSIYTRAVRAVVMREKEKEYISAVTLMGLSHIKIIFFHILPNVRKLVGVIMIIDLANCILLEATLSFLGLGLPATIPSLGTTIRVGTNYFLSGSWWIVTFPGLTVILVIYCINIIKDYIEEQSHQ